jgi:hypothetical protein
VYTWAPYSGTPTAASAPRQSALYVRETFICQSVLSELNIFEMHMFQSAVSWYVYLLLCGQVVSVLGHII